MLKLFCFIYLFLFQTNTFALIEPSQVGHKYVDLKINDVQKFISQDKRIDYILFTDSGTYKIKSINDYTTLKVASFLKVNRGKKKKIVLHFNYFNVGAGKTYQYSFRVCNVFAD